MITMREMRASKNLKVQQVSPQYILLLPSTFQVLIQIHTGNVMRMVSVLLQISLEISLETYSRKNKESIDPLMDELETARETNQRVGK